jgi:hypothetical protein
VCAENGISTNYAVYVKSGKRCLHADVPMQTLKGIFCREKGNVLSRNSACWVPSR